MATARVGQPGREQIVREVVRAAELGEVDEVVLAVALHVETEQLIEVLRPDVPPVGDRRLDPAQAVLLSAHERRCSGRAFVDHPRQREDVLQSG
jgi:hypothetical protein